MIGVFLGSLEGEVNVHVFMYFSMFAICNNLYRSDVQHLHVHLMERMRHDQQVPEESWQTPVVPEESRRRLVASERRQRAVASERPQRAGVPERKSY